jgi:hypothetical protein
MNRLAPTAPSSIPCYDVPWNKSVAEVDALILHSQNENIESLSEEDRPL